MLGAIVGDIIGSVHEYMAPKHTEFPLFVERSTFTDDTVLTVAIADAIMAGADYGDKLYEYAVRYPGRGYGGGFLRWTDLSPRIPYNSWGNGSAMRVSAVGFAFNELETVIREAGLSAEVTHNHPEGIKGAQATAAAIFLARKGECKGRLRSQIAERFGYDLSRGVDDIRPAYSYDISCQGTVPEALIAFLDSSDYESAIRLAISLGGDADTLACITGGIAEAYYGGIPAELASAGRERLAPQLREVVDQFRSRYM